MAAARAGKLWWAAVTVNPLVQARMTVAALAGLPKGWAYAGAQAIIVSVESGYAATNAEMARLLVQLDYVPTLAAMVVALVEQGRQEVAATISKEMLKQGAIAEATAISAELVSSGHMSETLAVARALAEIGDHNDMIQILRGSGAGGLMDTLGIGTGDQKKEYANEGQRQAARGAEDEAEAASLLDDAPHSTAQEAPRLL